MVVLERVCSTKWQICYPILPLWMYIAIGIIIIVIFGFIGWMLFMDRRDKHGSNN